MPADNAPDHSALIAQMRRGALGYCVMALIRDEELYGFEIVQRLREFHGMVTSEGTIYPLLSRLRKERMVDTTWRESGTGPPRRYYRLTHAGGQALDVFTEEWRRFSDGVDAVLRGRADPQGRNRVANRLKPNGNTIMTG